MGGKKHTNARLIMSLLTRGLKTYFYVQYGRFVFDTTRRTSDRSNLVLAREFKMRLFIIPLL
jgi:hypothetical protein